MREFVELRGAQLGYAHRVARQRASRSRASTATPASVLVKIDPRYFRPTEVETLLGDPTQGQGEARLGARGRRFDELVREMVEADLDDCAQRDAHVAQHGFKVYHHHE